MEYDLGKNAHQGELIIRNGMGSIVEQRRLPDKKGRIELNLSNYENGLFFYEIRIDNKVERTGKIMVTK